MATVLGLQHPRQTFQWIFRTDFLRDWLVWSSYCPRDSQESLRRGGKNTQKSCLLGGLCYIYPAPETREMHSLLNSKVNILIFSHKFEATSSHLALLCLLLFFLSISNKPNILVSQSLISVSFSQFSLNAGDVLVSPSLWRLMAFLFLHFPLFGRFH